MVNANLLVLPAATQLLVSFVLIETQYGQANQN